MEDRVDSKEFKETSTKRRYKIINLKKLIGS